MTITEFAAKHKLSSRDSQIAKKVYGSEDKSEQAWINELKTKVDFDFKKAETLLKAKAKKNSSKEKNEDKGDKPEPKNKKNNKK